MIIMNKENLHFFIHVNVMTSFLMKNIHEVIHIIFMYLNIGLIYYNTFTNFIIFSFYILALYLE